MNSFFFFSSELIVNRILIVSIVVNKIFKIIDNFIKKLLKSYLQLIRLKKKNKIFSHNNNNNNNNNNNKPEKEIKHSIGLAC